ncbi:hypothetical protein CRUP_015148, partial [Coryphaenoides rupestris]
MDRVSVVQYSRDAEAHFYLNTYTTKDDVLDTVRGLRHKGGRTLNTGAALHVVEKLNVGENNDRVSVVQYSRDADAHFYLNTYTTKDDVLDTVRGLRHKGGRTLNTGAALHVVEKLNVGENNDRVSVVQYSRDAEAHFYLNTYTTKDDVLDTVRGLRHKGGRTLNTGAALHVVEKLNVGENNDRVSVVQYSRDAEAHFHLNTYTTKDDVLDMVRGLRHKGGRTLNTGAALQY